MNDVSEILILKRRTEITEWFDLPPLVVALAPLPEHDVGAIVDPTVVLVTMEGIKVEVDVVNHPNASESFPNIPALSP
jgi:hypothetical protein